ncbi:hypothetical protein [Paraclostridium sordellii]|uniref:HNH endonuclease n=1 Tax=Paraclostridium sordellii TaxID=1505 RepID=A0A9P1PBE8_PARSO|nr:hypothetical protein [Paeniclostridium sordellii]CEO33246.1 Uncharacterised protein [[Clostridium] sordellii] [Paeniclostridium sordellii]
MERGKMNLIELNTLALNMKKDWLENRCIMCRSILTEDNDTDEHIYPKWLLRKYNMFNKKLTLPNGNSMFYHKWIVKCCKECNGGNMSDMEEVIKKAVNKGYESFKDTNEEIIVWWLMKIYYAKIHKETMMKVNMADINSKKIIESEAFIKYDPIFMYMNSLFKGIKFQKKPYELFIFKTENEDIFDYIDDITTNTVFMRLNDILIVCRFNSFGFLGMFCERELIALNKVDKVHYLQVLELFSKMVYYSKTFGLKTKHEYLLKEDGAYITTEIVSVEEIERTNCRDMNEMLVNIFKLRDINIDRPRSENQTISFIFNSIVDIKTYEDIEANRKIT